MQRAFAGFCGAAKHACARPLKQSSKRTYDAPGGTLPRASRRCQCFGKARRALPNAPDCAARRDLIAATAGVLPRCFAVVAAWRDRNASMPPRCLRAALAMLLRCKPLRARITLSHARRWCRAATDAGVVEHWPRCGARVPRRVCKACRARAGVRVARVSKLADARLEACRPRFGASPAKPLSMRLFGKCDDARQSPSQSSRARCVACHRYARRCVKAAARAVIEGGSRSVRERA